MNLTREWVEDYLGCFGFHVCSGPSVAYFERNNIRYTYEVVGVGGIKPEAGGTGYICTSSERTVVEFFYELMKYVLSHGRPGDTVVWRRWPEQQERVYENSFDRSFDRYYTANCRITVIPGKVSSQELEEDYLAMVKRELPEHYKRIFKQVKGYEPKESEENKTESTSAES